MVDYCVCAEPLEERGVFSCGHALCLSCTLKKRVLMKDSHCPYCRTQSERVAIVASGSSDVSDARLGFQTGNLKVENPELIGKLRHILGFPCPDCDEEQKNYKTLKSHVQKDHGKALCDVCAKHEYNFSDEYRIFEQNKIKDHLKKQHIFCKYCHSYFYGNTEFSAHCREKHIGCGICERRNPENLQYFKEYDQLYEHYKAKHHLCMVPSCLENKHIVFGTALELRRHMIEAHRGLVSKSNRSQEVDLEQLNQDAEQAQAATANGRSDNPANESEKSRYEARLRISARHDKEKISKLQGANSTFLNKSVPAEIFIATYESVLKDSPRGEITALLSAFKKAYKPVLSETAFRTLEFKLMQRSAEERGEEDQRSILKHKPSPANSSSSATPKPSARGPAPTDVHRFNWGYNVSAAGISDISSLPALGSNKKPSRASNGTAVMWKPQKPTGVTSGLQNLPTLPKKPSKLPASRQEALSTRQTSIPLGNSRSGQSSFFSSLRSSPSSSNSGSSSSLSSASSSAAPVPASALSNRSANASQQSVTLGSLPALPSKSKGDDGNKKRQKHVLRMV